MRRISILATTILFASQVHAALALKPEDVIKSTIHRTVPKAEIKSIEASPIKGLYTVKFPNNETIYFTADGKYALQGALLRVDGKSIVNVSEQENASSRAAILGKIDDAEFIKFSPKGTPKASLIVFADTDCGYCRKLHQEAKAYTDAGIELKILAWPRSFPQTGSDAGTALTMAKVWCSANPQAAYNQASDGKEVDMAAVRDISACKKQVAQQYALGASVGVTGTPAIFDGAGRQVGGYRSAEDMLKVLGL